MSDQDSKQIEALKKLREPFLSGEMLKLPKPYKKDSPKGKCAECGGYHGLPAAHLDYVGHAALTDRLLKVDPLWSWEPLAFGPNGLPQLDEHGGLWIRLTVAGMTRLGYGDAEAKKGPNAIKEAIGDALRNAAMRFGAALDLWHKGELRRDEDDEPAAPIELINDAQVAELSALIEETKSNKPGFLAFFKVDAVELLPAASFAKAKDLLMLKKERPKQ